MIELSWLKSYLQRLCEQPQFADARSVAPLWLTPEHGATLPDQHGATPAARLTIQMAAELFPRLALVGSAGAGKTTVLRQLACGLAEMLLNGEIRSRATKSASGNPATPLPIYIEMAHFEQNLDETLAGMSGSGAPPLLELARNYPLLFLLDGLDELAPDRQLAALSSLSQTMTTLGTQARWISTCRTENLALFRPWLGSIEVRSIRPLAARDVIDQIQRQHGDHLAGWLRRFDDLIGLAGQPRWLTALQSCASEARSLGAPYSRGKLLAAWLPAVVEATLDAHTGQIPLDLAIEALPLIAAALDKRQSESISLPDLMALLAEKPAGRLAHTVNRSPAMIGKATIQLLIGSGVLTLDTERQQIAFRHPTLRSFGQAMQLTQSRPEAWPATIFSRAWGDAVVFAYGLCDDRQAVLRRMLASGGVGLTARCLIDAEPQDQFDALLERSASLTPPLRVMLADAFSTENLRGAALEQLERAGQEGYDEAGLFGRLGELYSAASQWNHARAAYEQALARENDDLRYRQQLGVVCSRLGELDQAAAALETVLEAQQRRSAAAAHELGHIYIQQGYAERALNAYRQAVTSQPHDPAYRRSVASALRQLSRLDEAETVLRELLAEHTSDVSAHADLGQVYAATGRIQPAIASYSKAIILRPTDAALYYEIGKLRRTSGDLPGARAALQRAAELDAADAALHFELGQVCEACGEYAGALAAYRHAVQLDSRNETYLRRLGALLRDRGEDEEAAIILRTALELRPDSPETYAELAALLWREGQHDQALESYRRAISLAPRNADYERAIGHAYRQIGQLREAERHLSRAANLDPQRADLHHDLGSVSEALEQLDDALVAYERAAALAPAQAAYTRAAGGLHLRLGNHRRARTLLAHALWLNRKDAATLYQIGLLHTTAGNWPRAIFSLQRAAIAGRTAHYYDQLGRALTRVRRFYEARAAFEQALQIQPDSATTMHHYSIALDAASLIERAFDVARHAALQAPGSAEIQQHAGAMALRLGRHNEALALLDRATALDSQLVAAHIDRAALLLAMDQPEAALASARTATSLDPHHARAALIGGQALVRLARDSEARPFLERAVAIDQTLEPALAALRDLLLRAGAHRAAFEPARRAVAIDAQNPDHRLRLAHVLLAIGGIANAREQLELALRLCDEKTDAGNRDAIAAETYATLSRIHSDAADWNHALEYAQRAVALAPESGDYRAQLSRSFDGAGRPADAIEALAAAVERIPGRADWHYELGQLRRRAGDDATALPSLRRAALLADQAEYHMAVGRCLNVLGDSPGTVEALERALRLKPSATDWRLELAEIQSARGWYGEAAAELNQVIVAMPGLSRAWRLRAEALINLGQPDPARIDLIEALRRDPQDAHSFALLAILLRDLGNLENALDAAQRAVALDPQRPTHRQALAQVLRSAGRRADAIKQLEQALATGGPAAWWIDLAGDYEALGQADQARVAWERAITHTPANATLRYRYGCLLAQNGDITSAAEQLQEAISQRPDFAAAYSRLADVKLALGDTDAALQNARRAVALEQRQCEPWRVLGSILRAQHATSEAIQALRRAHELDANDPQAAFLLGLTLLENAQPTDSITALAAAITAAPEIATYHAYLGIAHRSSIVEPSDPDDLQASANPTALDQAHQAIGRALELEPATARWHYEAGVVEQFSGHHIEAVEAFNQTLALHDAQQTRRSTEHTPQYLDVKEVLRHRAISLYAMRRLDQARADQEIVVAALPHSASSQYLFGRIAYEQGDMAVARNAFAAASDAEPANWQALMFLGRALIALGTYPEAITILEQATELQPDHPLIAAVLSDAYAAGGRHDRALTTAARAVRLDPSAAEYHQRLASLYATSGRVHEARAALINAITLRPDVAPWHAQMGEICLRLNMTDAARGAYMRAIQLTPNESSYHYALSRLLAQQGRAAEARAALERALERSPDRGIWHYELGQLQLNLGEIEDALEHFRAAIQSSPDSIAHWQALASAQRHAESVEAAQETLERALARFGDDPTLHLAAGVLLEEQQHYQIAAWHYQIATEQAPTSAENWWRLGRVWLELERPDDARGALERALELDSNAAEAHAALARIFGQNEDGRSTLLHIQRAAELVPDDPAYQIQLAEAYSYMRRFDEARLALERAVTLVPEDPTILARYGEMAMNVGMNQEALKAFEKAIDQKPDEATYYLQAGRAHRRLKHYSRAIERFRRAIRLKPGYKDAVMELTTLGPLAFVARHLGGGDDSDDVAA